MLLNLNWLGRKKAFPLQDMPSRCRAEKLLPVCFLVVKYLPHHITFYIRKPVLNIQVLIPPRFEQLCKMAQGKALLLQSITLLLKTKSL